jgi:hypothetical protein
MAWGDIVSDAAQPSNYGDTSGFNSANSGSGINWQAAAQTLGAGSENTDTSKNPGTIPTLAPQNAPIPNSPVGRPSQPVNLLELIRLLTQRQQMYQQAATGPAGAGGPPQMPARAPGPGLLGI